MGNYIFQGSTEERPVQIVVRYFDGSWIREVIDFNGTFAALGRESSRLARELDQKYGDSHFWTVDAKNPEGNSFYQLFHGRLS
jgi:hypothetical protein